jgi:hypothetical protein
MAMMRRHWRRRGSSRTRWRGDERLASQRLLAGQAARTPQVAIAGRLPFWRQLASHAAIEGNVDLPALKQMLHFWMQGRQSCAASAELPNNEMNRAVSRHRIVSPHW